MLFGAKVGKKMQLALHSSRKKRTKSENLLLKQLVCLNRRFSLYCLWVQSSGWMAISVA